VFPEAEGTLPSLLCVRRLRKKIASGEGTGEKKGGGWALLPRFSEGNQGEIQCVLKTCSRTFKRKGRGAKNGKKRKKEGEKLNVAVPLILHVYVFLRGKKRKCLQLEYGRIRAIGEWGKGKKKKKGHCAIPTNNFGYFPFWEGGKRKFFYANSLYSHTKTWERGKRKKSYTAATLMIILPQKKNERIRDCKLRVGGRVG